MLFVHGMAHCLKLCLQDCARNCCCVRDALTSPLNWLVLSKAFGTIRETEWPTCFDGKVHNIL